MLDDIERDIDKDWTSSILYDFSILVHSLIELNKRRRNPDLCINGLQYYLREYCTIKIDIGRQTGKSTYIGSNFKENDLIITYNLNMCRLFKERFPNTQNNIISFRSLINQIELYGEKTYDTIWIDEYSIINQKTNIDVIYEYLGKNENQTFVFLG